MPSPGRAAPSYVHGASEVPLLGATIGDGFDATVERFPDREALVSCQQGVRFTWRELRAECDRFARGLLALGLRKGDRIGIWSPNRAEWVVAQLATAKLGAILVNVNPAYRAAELEYALSQSGCSALLLAPPYRTSNYAAILAEVCPEISTASPGALRAARLPELRSIIAIGDRPLPGGYWWDEVLHRGDAVPEATLAARQGEQCPDDPINIQYTSGTTGFPKGATLSHHAILNNGFFVGERLHLTEADRMCIPVPFYHCFGMVLGNLACVSHGATMVIPSEMFDPLATLEAVAAERCTVLHGVPTMFIAELGHAEFGRFDLSSLRTGVMGGSPCPVEVMREVVRQMHLREVTIAYGMTETAPVSFQTRTDDPIEKRVSTVGRVHPHVECKIVDPGTGATVPRGTGGEICTRGYSVMLGYWSNQEATRAAIDPARWMHTGDLGVMDAEGYVNIVGRIKDMIIRGGENIYPREIEEFLYGHPKIRDVQVIGVPDRKYGEEVMAWVVLRSGVGATPEEMREWCCSRMAHYKVPRYWRFTDAFPMTVSGKVQKFRMREIATRELGLEAAAAVSTA
ncbi:MAG TPA: AMP-binding protein [Gemmatimonadales bacterium]|nr:AMP-binding protein [Gemmatimonadales bacterium]